MKHIDMTSVAGTPVFMVSVYCTVYSTRIPYMHVNLSITLINFGYWGKRSKPQCIVISMSTFSVYIHNNV